MGDGVEGFVVDSMSGEGLRSRTCDRWSTMREVMVLGLRKEVVRSAVKMVVRWRSHVTAGEIAEEGNTMVKR